MSTITERQQAAARNQRNAARRIRAGLRVPSMSPEQYRAALANPKRER